MPEVERPRVHHQRTGFVWIRDFDVGMVTTLGGQIIPGKKGEMYRVTLPQLPEEERDVPCYLSTPEQPLVSFTIPRFVIIRDSFEPELSRWMPITEEYRIPAPESSLVSVPDPRGPTSAGPSQATIEGHDKYESKIQAWPYDFTYTIEIWARYQNFLQPMLFHVMRTFPPYGKMYLKDSLGESRSYNAFAEGGPSPMGEIASMTDRAQAFGYTVRVTGEIDLSDPVVMPSARYFLANLHQKERGEL